MALSDPVSSSVVTTASTTLSPVVSSSVVTTEDAFLSAPVSSNVVTTLGGTGTSLSLTVLGA